MAAAESTSTSKISKINVGGTEYNIGATYDENGNRLITTYATKSEVPTAYVKSASVSGNELTLTPASGESVVFSPSMESAVSSVNGQTGAVQLTYSDVGAQVAGSYQAAGNYVSYTNATASVAGTSKTVSKTSPQTLFVPNGLIMGGSAAAAGLTTRGICGVSTPGATGACEKDNLYLNYDSDTTYENGRKVVLGAGSTGTALAGGAYTYCAVRGDEMASYVSSAISGKQDAITAGTNVQISDSNVISATDTTYTAGDNITIDSSNKISSDAIIKLQDNDTTTAGTWLAKTDQISAYADGQVFLYKVTKAGTSTTTLNINGLGAKPVYRAGTSYLMTHFGVGQYILLTYNAQNTCFRVTNFYDSTDTENIRTRYFRPYAAETIYRYKFVVLDADNRMVPITTTNQASAAQVAKTPTAKAFKPHNIWYYSNSATVNAGAVVTDATLYWQSNSNTPWPYNFNESIPTYRLIYLKGTYDKTTDLFTLYNDGSSPCKSYYAFVPTNTASITLSDYLEEGFYYWLIAGSYSTANQATLLPDKELYYFDGENLVPVSGGDPNSMVTTYTRQSISEYKSFEKGIGASDYDGEYHGTDNYSDLTGVGAKYFGKGISVLGEADYSTYTYNLSFPKKSGTLLLDSDLSGYATETWVTDKGYTTNTGTVTSVAVKMNNAVKGTVTTSGTIDLGTVITAHQDISGKVDANSAIAGATKTKITYDSKGLVTAGSDLAASDIPSLPASKITSGTFADERIASASTWNAKQSALSSTQLAACNSGITSTKVSTYDGYATMISGKQDKITSSNKLAASLVSGLSTVATSGSYSDLTNKPTIDSSLSTTSTNAVQNSIVTSAINSKADSSALGDQVTFSYDSSTGTLTISPK